MIIRCHKCGYEWTYKGKRTVRATCPNCFAQVRICVAKTSAKR